MTQQQLADAVAVSRPAVTQWETGETKSLEGENLVNVARVLWVTVEWLLHGWGLGPGEGALLCEASYGLGADAAELPGRFVEAPE